MLSQDVLDSITGKGLTAGVYKYGLVGLAVALQQREGLFGGIVTEGPARDGWQCGPCRDGAERSRHPRAGVGIGDLPMARGAGLRIGVPTICGPGLRGRSPQY